VGDGFHLFKQGTANRRATRALASRRNASEEDAEFEVEGAAKAVQRLGAASVMAMSVFAGVEGVVEPAEAAAPATEISRPGQTLPEGVSLPEPTKRVAPAPAKDAAKAKPTAVASKTAVKPAATKAAQPLAASLDNFSDDFKINLKSAPTPIKAAPVKNAPTPLPAAVTSVARKNYDEDVLISNIRGEAKKGTKKGVINGVTKSPTPVYAAAAGGVGAAVAGIFSLGAKGGAAKGAAGAGKAAASAAKGMTATDAAEAAAVVVAGGAAGETGKSIVKKASRVINVRKTPEGEIPLPAQLITAASLPAGLIGTLVGGLSAVSTEASRPPDAKAEADMIEKVVEAPKVAETKSFIAVASAAPAVESEEIAAAKAEKAAAAEAAKAAKAAKAEAAKAEKAAAAEAAKAEKEAKAAATQAEREAKAEAAKAAKEAAQAQKEAAQAQKEMSKAVATIKVLDAQEDAEDAAAAAAKAEKALQTAAINDLDVALQKRLAAQAPSATDAAKAKPAKAGAEAASDATKDYKSELGSSLSGLSYDAITDKYDDYYKIRERYADDDDSEDPYAGKRFDAPKRTAPAVTARAAPSAPKFNFALPSIDLKLPELPAIESGADSKAEDAKAAKKAEAEAKKKEAEAEAEAKKKAEAEAKKKEAEAEAEAKKKAETEAKKKAEAEAKKKAEAEAKKAEAAKKVEPVKIVAAPAMSSASNDLGFDFSSLSKSMESTPSAPKPKTDKEEAKAAKKAAEAAKKAEAEAKKAEAAKKVEPVKIVAAPAMSSASNDLGFDFSSLSQYMESTPSAPKPKTDKEEAKAAKKAAEAAKKAEAEAKKKAEAEAKKAEAAKKVEPVKIVAAPAMSSASNDLGFDFSSLSQYMESTPSAPKPKTDKEESKAAAQAAAKAKKEAEAAKKEAAKKEAETKKAAAKAAAEQAKAERAAAKADKKPFAKPAKPAKREVVKNKPSFTKSKGSTEFKPFAGAYRPVAAEKTSLPGQKVDVNAIIDSQDAKADATLAKANVETGDFLNISPEAGFGIAATLAFVYETENKKFEEKRKAAMNAPKSTPSKPVGSGGESTTEGWFSGFLSSLVKDGAKTTVKKATPSAAQKSEPAKNATQAQQWIDKWLTSSSDPSKDAQKWIDKWSSSRPAAPKAEAPEAKAETPKAEAPKAKAEAPKAEAPKAPKSDPAKNAQEAQAWIDKWSSSVKTTTTAATTTTTTTATKATKSDNLTADQRTAAEEWIKKWRADGRPTDESRFGDAKKWLKEHNFEE